MEQIIQQKVAEVTSQIEQQLDAEIERLDKLDIDDIEKLREKRLKDMKKLQQQQQTWRILGHGEYSELSSEKEFFEISKKSKNIVCHFYKDSTPRCKIVDMHLKVLATKHLEARFCKLNVEKAPFLTERLRIKVIPTIALVADSKAKDYIVGFTELGNCDDFTTEMLEWRIAQSQCINYSGDLSQPPEKNEKPKLPFNQKKKTIRGRESDDSSDDDY